MSADEIIIGREGPVLTVTFNRPEARNAMTWDMYEGLYAACETADGDDAVRAMLLRGAGSAAFVAGTDISQFTEFTTGADGIAYEEKITRVVSRLETVRVPTVAAVQGSASAAGWRSPRCATSGSPTAAHGSGSRSPARSATACP